MNSDLKTSEVQYERAISLKEKIEALEAMKAVELKYNSLAAEIPQKYSASEYRFVPHYIEHCHKAAEEVKAKVSPPEATLN